MKTQLPISPFLIKVFVEDTDFQGFVYHANYIKYFERARSQFLNDIGFFQSDDKQGYFVVRKISLQFVTPAKLEDELLVNSTVTKASKARSVFYQQILRGDTIIANAEIEVCYVNSVSGRPEQFPKQFLDRI